MQVHKLELNGTYQFRIKAENKYGVSDGCDSEKVLLKDPFGLPGAPRNPKIIAATSTSMTLTWDPPLDNGGSTIQGYWLEKRERGAVYWGRVNRSPATKPAVKGLQYTVLRLIEGTEYQFRVAACNAAGVGPPSEASECGFAVDPCSECRPLTSDVKTHSTRTEKSVLTGQDISYFLRTPGKSSQAPRTDDTSHTLTPQSLWKRLC